MINWKIPDYLKRKIRIQDILKNLFGHCDCGERLKQCEKDKAYCAKRIKSLSKTLTHSIILPEVTDHRKYVKEIKPWKIIRKLGNFDLVTADEIYYALPVNSWIKILKSIQPQVEKVLEKWRRDISDCDDFALVTASTVAASFAYDPFERQVAFAIAWSNTHAYDLFITTEGTCEIYEPQSNAVVGRLGKTSGIYETKKIWFMG